jgi:hypothetical protein
MLHRNNKLVWTGINGHNLDTECNDHLCCGCQQKNQCPQTFRLCIQQQLYICFTEIMIVIQMEDNNDWLASKKTWKKWTRIGDRELLSYDGINFHKPIDEEQ